MLCVNDLFEELMKRNSRSKLVVHCVLVNVDRFSLCLSFLILKYAICVILYCDVVNVQIRLNFSDEIIK